VRPLANGLEALEHLDRVGAVLLDSVGKALASLGGIQGALASFL
jgi:hypothetical protein